MPQFIDARDHKMLGTTRWLKRRLRCHVGYRTLRFLALSNEGARNGWCSSTRERYTRASHNQVHSARTFRHVEYVGYRTQRFPTLTNGFCMRSTVGTRQLASVAPPPVTIKCTGCAIFVTWRDRTVFTSI